MSNFWITVKPSLDHLQALIGSYFYNEKIFLFKYFFKKYSLESDAIGNR